MLNCYDFLLPKRFLHFYTLETGCTLIANISIVLSVLMALIQVVVLAMMALLCVSETKMCIKWPTPTIVIGCFFGVCLCLSVQIFAKMYKNGVCEGRHKPMYWFTMWMSAGPTLAVTVITINLLILHLPWWIVAPLGLLQLAISIYAYLCIFSLYRIIKAENREDAAAENNNDSGSVGTIEI